MSYKMLLLLAFIMIITLSCENSKKNRYNDVMRDLLEPFRNIKPAERKSNKLENELYHAVYREDIEKVKSILATGIDPNSCRGESGWMDSNPLNVLATGFYATYYRNKRKEFMPDPAPDVAVFNILKEYSVDLNARPYIWIRVFLYNNRIYDSIIRQRKIDNGPMDSEAVEEEMNFSIKDANRLLEAFLEAGIDPDKKGHPYPFSYEAMKERITNEEAERYFSEGTRAINIAIEKGIRWESQVDLLLRYTDLDEESLIAANKSNDPLMIEKIDILWKTQRGAQE